MTPLPLRLAPFAVMAALAPGLAQAQEVTDVAARTGVSDIDGKLSLPAGLQLDAGRQGVGVGLALAASGWVSPAGMRQTAVVKVRAQLDGADDLKTSPSLDGLQDLTSLTFRYQLAALTGVRDDPDPEEETKLCAEAERRFQADPALMARRPPGFTCDAFGTDIADMVGLGREARKLYFEPDAAVILTGVTGSVARESYDYLTPATFARARDRFTPWSVGAFVTYSPVSTAAAFTLSYEHQRTREDVPKQTVCAATGACVKGIVGRAPLEHRDNIAIDVRRRFEGLGVGATATYDIANDRFGVEIPIYWPKLPLLGLAPGVKIGWTDQRDEVSVRMVISRPFGVLGAR